MSNFKQIGFIGAGNMGKGIAKTLLEKDYSVYLLAHRNRANVETLVGFGAEEVSSVAQLLEQVRVVITCLPSRKAIESVYGALLGHARKDTILIDTSTSDPELTRKLQAEAAENGLDIVDAPLLGGPQMTWEGKIGLAVGGVSNSVDKAKPILEDFSSRIFYAGGPSTGHSLKLINNAVTLTNSAILYEAFAVAKKSGIDLSMLYEAMDASAASSKRLHGIAPCLINDEHPISFALNVASKDLVLYSAFAGETGVPTLVSDAAKNQYKLAQSMGYGEQSVTRIATALAKLAGVSFDE